MSESTVIQPAPGQAILTTDSNHRDRNHEQHQHHGHCDTVDMANYRALTQQGERFGTTNGDRTTNGVQVTGDRINTVGAAGALASGRTDSLVQGGFGDTADRICVSTKDVTAALGGGFTAGALAACETDKAVADVKFIGMETAKDGLIALNVASAAIQNGVNTGFAAQNVLASTIGNAQNVLATTIGNAASVQATDIGNRAAVQLERVRAELDAKQAAGFSAGVLLATQLDAQARREAAKCCCDGEKLAMDNFAKLAALVTGDGNTTRALVNEIESDRKAERIRFLETQVLVLGGGATARSA